MNFIYNKKLADHLNNQIPQIEHFMKTGEDLTEGIEFVEVERKPMIKQKFN